MSSESIFERTKNRIYKFYRDIKIITKILRVKKASHKIYQTNSNFGRSFADTVNNFGNKTIEFYDTTMTFTELNNIATKIAKWGSYIGMQQGQVVPLFANNSPLYLAIWIGLSKLNVVSALINNNLTNQPLIHCIDVALQQSKANRNNIVIFDESHRDAINTIKTSYVHTTFVSIEEIMTFDTSRLKFVEYTSSAKPNDPLLYIFTSGTTGMPKAAKISHLRYLSAGYAMKIIYELNNKDKMYISLPLYHSNGGMLGISASFITGMDIVIREKFSASNYFRDCSIYNCTVGMYIGECCRYILNTNPSVFDKFHNMRLLIGNGLRIEVWEPFVKRFGVKIGEFYGSTEGNANLFNTENKTGAIGYLPWLLRQVYPVKFIKINLVNEMPVKDGRLYCIETDVDEPGEAIGLINNCDALRKFEGYTNSDDTKKKILHNAFSDDDIWFRTGDLLKRDKDGYVYFVDRLGDTFRWKGENVSTNEVSSTLMKEPVIDGMLDCTVYGVEVPNCDGRAGMAAIQTTTWLDFTRIYSRIQTLPKYAQPQFIRILQNIKTTGTYKHKKNELRKEGIDLTKITDPIFIIDYKQQTYRPLTIDIYNNIINNTYTL